MNPIPVSVFNTLIQSQLQSLGVFEVIGEITELRITAKKGVFITLKDSDEAANLSVSGYAPWIKGLDLVEVGMSVVVSGTPDLYVPYGKFSLKAVSFRPHGEGALKVAYEKLFAKLKGEGLFDAENKKSAPDHFEKIALITAAGSAAEGDFIKVLRESGVSLSVDFYPVSVQGANAVSEIASALQKVAESHYDAVILIRGGGSLEDLIAFNDEQIVRLVAIQPHFTVVGVGHERDESLADYAADFRVSTPTQAAVFLYETNLAWLDHWIAQVMGIGQSFTQRSQKVRSTIAQVTRGMDQRLLQAIQTMRFKTERHKHTVQQSLARTVIRLQRFDQLRALIDSYSPKRQLERGYSMLRDEKGGLIKSVGAAEKGSSVEIVLRDGELRAQVQAITKRTS